MKILYTAYLTILFYLTYDLITSSISRIVRNKLDTDITHLAIVSIMWAGLIMFYFN